MYMPYLVWATKYKITTQTHCTRELCPLMLSEPKQRTFYHIHTHTHMTIAKKREKIYIICVIFRTTSEHHLCALLGARSGLT